ncbi:hypothetical protein N8349_03635 [Gammaproteobacteria bacterium]|nr:hypothetical protein [Gammaproteobacteria bacterium]
MVRIVFLLLLSPLAFAEINLPDKLEFYLTCKVSDQVVLGIKDGESSRYTHFLDTVKDGDSFGIKFSMKYTEDFYNLGISSKGLQIVGTSFKSDELKWLLPASERYIFINDSLGGVQGNLNSNKLLINNLFSKTSIERYFKNDWQLITSSTLMAEGTRLLTANCMNMPSKFDDMLEIIEGVSGKLDN